MVDWLADLGLGQHAAAFAENAVDFDALALLSDDDLKELGLPLGHRRKLQAALKTPDRAGGTARSDPPAAQPAPPAADAERRQVTVLFCDLVGSTGLASRLDPEDMRDLLRAYQKACSEIIARYDGYVAKLMGDGVFAYFGYPRAHEDDAERAISAGLGIVPAVKALGRGLSVRIGIATGPVAIGDIAGEGPAEEAAITGEAPNLAARLQDGAAPDTVVIGAATHRLAGVLFECQDLGTISLKGFENPARAWAVLGPKHADSRFAATRGGRLSPLIGRDEELEILRRRWERTKSGNGQVVLISGEPGIGKSRLLHAFRDLVADEAYYVRIQQCSPHHTNSALFPFTDLTARSLGLSLDESGTARAIGVTPEDTNSVRIDKLEAWIRLSGQPVEKYAALFGSVLGIDTSERYPPLTASPQRRRELLIEAFAARLAGLASQGPVLFVIEDCHWIDPTSRELIDRHIEQARDMAVMIVVTYRPEFMAPWVGQSHTALLALNRLDRAACAALAAEIGEGAALPGDVIERIVERTDGVPLFVEELTKTVVEEGAAARRGGETPSGGPIPPTLQDALEARLDRLGEARELAQIGAVIGREFGFRLLQHVSGLAEDELRGRLDRLVRSELVFQRGQPPDASYSFKHALVQDTAYGSMLRTKRAELHEAAAHALERQFPERTSSEPELLAHHYGEAGRFSEGAAYYLAAGQAGFRGSAVQEALAHLSRGLELIEKLAPGAARAETEAGLYATLGLVHKVMNGVGDEGSAQAFSRAQAICREHGIAAHRFPSLFGLYHFHWGSGQLDQAARDADELLEIAETSGETDQLMIAQCATGMVRFFQGSFSAAAANFERSREMYDGKAHRELAYSYMMEFGVMSGFNGGNALFVLGYPDKALERTEETVALARTRQPINLCTSLSQGCDVLIRRGDTQKALDWSNKCLELADRFGFWHPSAFARINRGWALAQLGDMAGGLRDLEDGIARLRESGTRAWRPRHDTLLAEARIANGQTDLALSILDSALALIAETGEQKHKAVVLAVKGDALLRAGASDRAERSYLTALEIARGQSAKSWELGAAIRLARLWHSQGRPDDARDLLAPVYSWFTEGFETAALKEAKALLAALA